MGSKEASKSKQPRRQGKALCGSSCRVFCLLDERVRTKNATDPRAQRTNNKRTNCVTRQPGARHLFARSSLSRTSADERSGDQGSNKE